MITFPSAMFARSDVAPPPQSPFATWALALPFAAGGPCVVDAVTYASLGAVPGYVFTDNGDNLPTIDGGGYHSLIAEASRMKIAAPTIGDEDFIHWAVADVAADGGGLNILTVLTNAADDYAHMLQMYRPGGDITGYARAAGSDVYLSAVATVASGRTVALLRRKAGNFQTFVKKPDSTIASGADTIAAMPAVTRLFVGTRFDGSTASAKFEGVYARLGTFSDGDVTALLAAA